MAFSLAPMRRSAHAARGAVAELLNTLRRTPLRAWPTLPFGIGPAALLIAASYLVSAAFGVLRQALFNQHFGIGEEAAALFTAIRLAETLSTLVAGGALANAVIPGVIALQPDGAAAVNRLIARLLTIVLLVLFPLLALTAAAAPWLIGLLGAGLAPATRETAVVLARILSLEVLLIAVEGLLSAVLLARRWFLLPALGVVLRNSVIITTLLSPDPSITTVAVASLGDSVIQLLVLIPGLLAAGFRPSFGWRPHDRQVRQTLHLFTPASLSALVNYSGTTVDTALATIGGAAAGLGAVSNAWLVVGLPIRLIGTAPAQAALPRLSTFATDGRLTRLTSTAHRLLFGAIGSAALLAAAYALIGAPLISAVYQRGAFDAAAVTLTAAALAAYAPAIPAAVGTELLTRILLALGDTRAALIANLAQQAVRVAVALFLLPQFGALAVPIGFSISSYVECVLLAAFTQLRLRHRQRP